MATKKRKVEPLVVLAELQKTEEGRAALRGFVSDYRTENPVAVMPVTIPDLLKEESNRSAAYQFVEEWFMQTKGYKPGVWSRLEALENAPAPKRGMWPVLVAVLACALVILLLCFSQRKPTSADGSSNIRAIETPSAGQIAQWVDPPKTTKEPTPEQLKGAVPYLPNTVCSDELGCSVSSPSTRRRQLSLRVKARCWVRVRQTAPRELLWKEGTVDGGFRSDYALEPGTTFEVKTGCPGYVEYWEDGNALAFVNRSKHPESTELVTISY